MRVEHLDRSDVKRYLHGPIDPVFRKWIEKHILECAPCRERLRVNRQAAEDAHKITDGDPDAWDGHYHGRTLSLYHWKQVDQEDRQVIEAHLQDCASCRSELELERMETEQLRDEILSES